MRFNSSFATSVFFVMVFGALALQHYDRTQVDIAKVAQKTECYKAMQVNPKLQCN